MKQYVQLIYDFIKILQRNNKIFKVLLLLIAQDVGIHTHTQMHKFTSQYFCVKWFQSRLSANELQTHGPTPRSFPYAATAAKNWLYFFFLFIEERRFVRIYVTPYIDMLDYVCVCIYILVSANQSSHLSFTAILSH